jgi:hypothetical protein
VAGWIFCFLKIWYTFHNRTDNCETNKFAAYSEDLKFCNYLNIVGKGKEYKQDGRVSYIDCGG